MGAQHTPGPFSIRLSRDGSGDVGIKAAGVPNVIAECFAAVRRADERSCAEAMANAHLFAAAPELLKAVRDFIQWVDHPSDIEDICAVARDERRVAAARAVIVKAEGRAP